MVASSRLTEPTVGDSVADAGEDIEELTEAVDKIAEEPEDGMAEAGLVGVAAGVDDPLQADNTNNIGIVIPEVPNTRRDIRGTGTSKPFESFQTLRAMKHPR